MRNEPFPSGHLFDDIIAVAVFALDSIADDDGSFMELLFGHEFPERAGFSLDGPIIIHACRDLI